MDVLGITFVGTRTPAHAEMAAFVRDVLGLAPMAVGGADADFFACPDGTSFAVSAIDEGETAERTVGFLVEDLELALAELRVAGVETEEIATTDQARYAHFRGPDGRLYELVQRIG